MLLPKRSLVFTTRYLFWTYFLLCNFICESLKQSEELLFENFIVNYSKDYGNDLDEKTLRFKIFQQSLARQSALNEAEKQLGGTARYGMNKFSDLTPEEFQKLHLSPRRKIANTPHAHSSTAHVAAGTRFDWRDKGKIGPIRNQYECGSCWAFAVVETIGSAYAILANTSIQHVLSAQQVISCDFNPTMGLNGCNGGILVNAFHSLVNLGLVLVDDATYPFVSKKGEKLTCMGGLPQKGVELRNYSYFEKVDVADMVHLLMTGPLTTSVNAVAWQDYLGGVVQHHCTNTYVDHAVQVVGYDNTSDVPYWIIRNTWGEDWGEDGYIRILQSNDNLCGLQDEVAVVTLAVGVNL